MMAVLAAPFLRLIKSKCNRKSTLNPLLTIALSRHDFSRRTEGIDSSGATAKNVRPAT